MKPSKLGRWCPGASKNFKLAMASRRAALSGNNTSLIAAFSNHVFTCKQHS